DLRTVYLRPHTQWPAGAALQPFVPNSVRDMSGNTPINVSGGLTPSTFPVSYDSPPPAAVAGSSPRFGATDTPLNDLMQLQSSGNIAGLAGVVSTVMENGVPLDSSIRVEKDGRTMTVVPSRPLGASSLIDVTVSGLSNDPYHFSFTTGTDLDFVTPVAMIWPTGGLNPVLASGIVRIRFNERINPFSI